MAKVVLKVGDALTDVSAPNEAGETVRLLDFKGKSGVILFFFPKADTPGCTTESCGYRDELPRFDKKGYVVLGASRDEPAKLKAFQDKYGLKFHLLSDPKAELAGLFGFAPGERSTVLIGKDGKIEQVLVKVAAKSTVQEVLGGLK